MRDTFPDPDRSSRPRPASRPAWGASVSPDGTAFAHLVDEDGYPRAVQRFLGGPNGLAVSSSRYVRLPVEGPITKVIHSADGHWLACQVAPHAGNRSQVWVVTTDPQDPTARRVDTDADEREGSAELIGWDGNLVAVTIEGGDGVGVAQLVTPATGEVTVLDRRPLGRLVDAWSGSALVRVGPRGDRAMTLLRGGVEVPLFADDRGSTTDPGILLDDRRPRRLLAGARGTRSRVYPPATEVDGDTLQGYVRAIVRTDHGTDRFHLVQATVTPEGVSHRMLAERDDCDLDEFTVSDDLTRAALLWNVDGGRSELQILELSDGSLHEPIPLPAPVASDLSISADGSLLALTVQGPGWPRSIVLVDLRTGAAATIEAAPDHADPIEPTLHRWVARDGLELSGWLFRPRGAEGPVPTLVWFHGGPEGQTRPEHSDVFPTLLDAGIAVFAPNVRGSSGFGRAFSHADDVEKRYAGIEDVVDVVAYLLDAGFARRGEVAVSGRSYGGYLTLAALTFHPELFVTGIAICGMSDLRTFYALTEPWIGRAAYSKYGHPEHDADLLEDLSPLPRVAQVRVPLLLIHGLNDTNVPVPESTQMAAAVRAHGGRAETLLVPDEGHDFSKPENRRLLARRVREWLVEHLLGHGDAPSAR